MIIERTPNGIIIGGQHCCDCVTVGLTMTYFMIKGERHPIAGQKKPHDDYTMGELAELWAQFKRVRDIRYGV